MTDTCASRCDFDRIQSYQNVEIIERYPPLDEIQKQVNSYDIAIKDN